MNTINVLLISILLLLSPNLIASIPLETPIEHQMILLDSDQYNLVNHIDRGARYNIQGWVYVHIQGDP
ncbi:MAG: hypothetical protein V1769_05390, partial [Thermoplasmatota archaeon]